MTMTQAAPVESCLYPAPAKLNLFLHVVGRRPDGYHLLQSLFIFLDYGDAEAYAAKIAGDTPPPPQA